MSVDACDPKLIVVKYVFEPRVAQVPVRCACWGGRQQARRFKTYEGSRVSAFDSKNSRSTLFEPFKLEAIVGFLGVDPLLVVAGAECEGKKVAESFPTSRLRVQGPLDSFLSPLPVSWLICFHGAALEEQWHYRWIKTQS